MIPNSRGSGGRDAAAVEAIARGLTPDHSFDRCRETALLLVEALASSGVEARAVQHAGHIPERPHANPRWLAIDRRSWLHWAVEVPDLGLHVDATFGQFDPACDAPRIQTIAAARAEWSATH